MGRASVPIAIIVLLAFGLTGCASHRATRRLPPEEAVTPDRLSLVWSSREHTGRITDVEFSRSGQLLATKSEDETVKVWDMRHDTPVTTIGSGYNVYEKTAFRGMNRVGYLLISPVMMPLGAMMLYEPIIWPLAVPLSIVASPILALTIDAETYEIGAMTFSTVNEEELFVCKANNTIQVLNIHRNEPVVTRDAHQTSSGSVEYSVCRAHAVYSPGTPRIFVDGTVERPSDTEARPAVLALNSNTLKVERFWTGKSREMIRSLAVSPSGERVAVGKRDGATEVFRMSNSDADSPFRTIRTHNHAKRLVWTSDGNYLVGLTDVGDEVKVWNARTGKSVVSSERIGLTWDIALTPDDQILIVAHDESLSFYRLDGLEKLWSVQAHNDDINAVEVSPDGDFIATASGYYTTGRGVRDFSVKVWRNPFSRVDH